MFLSLLIFLPLVYAMWVLVLPDRMVKPVSLALSCLHFAISLYIFKAFDKTAVTMQLVESHDWLANYGIKYSVGIDGVSLWLVILTTFLTPIIFWGSWSSINERVKSFHVCMFGLQTAMLGTFLSLDMILFYVFWEFSLVPMYFMVGIWGGSKRIYATVKFFLFTMLGSVLMLVAIMALIYMTKEQLGHFTAAISDLYKLQIPFVAGELLSPQSLMFVAFALAFAIKVPMFPVHTWLPDAHTEAPTPGSVILAGVMLKMGGYGIVRFAIPIFPEAAQYFAPTLMWLAAIGVIYGALVAMVQPDIKKLVAYSSVSHMGAVMLGLFALNSYGVQGGMFQMLNHGISTGALFLLVGMIYERTHSREIAKYGGLALAMPIYTICFVIITLSSIAVPGTNGFIGEFLILMGAFGSNKWAAGISVTGVIFGAAYMLWMVKRVFFGMPGELVAASVPAELLGGGHGHHNDHDSHAHQTHHAGDDHHKLTDLNFRELAIMVVMIVMVFWMGIKPGFFMDWSNASIEHFVKNFRSYEIMATKQEVK